MILDQFETYQGLMADFASKFIIPIKDAEDKGEDFEPEGYDDFYKVFSGFTDICETIETIELLQVMIEVNPPNSRRISVDLYCKHVVSSYLSEVYILKERLNSYATKISRMYLRSKFALSDTKGVDHLYFKIKKSMESINNTRNTHVHSHRYSDNDLNWLSSLKLVSDHDDKFKVGLRNQYKLVRQKWSQQIFENNRVMITLLQEYFNDIFKVICLDGEIVLPAKRNN